MGKNEQDAKTRNWPAARKGEELNFSIDHQGQPGSTNNNTRRI